MKSVTFRNKAYALYQCINGIFRWYERSKIGEYTRYYDKLIFHTDDGFYAAYANDLDNYWKI